MKLFLTAAALAALTLPSLAATPVRQVIYNVDAAAQCSAAANDQADLKLGLGWCDTALSDPLSNHRAALLMDRGVVKARLANNAGALEDYNAAIATDANLGDAYEAEISRSYLSQLEKGSFHASLKIIGKLADVLEIDPAELLADIRW